MYLIVLFDLPTSVPYPIPDFHFMVKQWFIFTNHHVKITVAVNHVICADSETVTFRYTVSGIRWEAIEVGRVRWNVVLDDLITGQSHDVLSSRSIGNQNSSLTSSLCRTSEIRPSGQIRSSDRQVVPLSNVNWRQLLSGSLPIQSQLHYASADFRTECFILLDKIIIK